MPKMSQAAAVIRAAEKAQGASKRVMIARRELTKAERAQEAADQAYLDLVSEALAGRQHPQESRQEVHQSPSA